LRDTATPPPSKRGQKEQKMKIASHAVRQIRQGDVLLTRIEQPATLRRVADDAGQPLAGLHVPGERTGHAHRLPSRVYDSAAGRVLMVETPAILVHEEHEHIQVPAGWWMPTLQQEYRPRRVVRRAKYD